MSLTRRGSTRAPLKTCQRRLRHLRKEGKSRGHPKKSGGIQDRAGRLGPPSQKEENKGRRSTMKKQRSQKRNLRINKKTKGQGPP